MTLTQTTRNLEIRGHSSWDCLKGERSLRETSFGEMSFATSQILNEAVAEALAPVEGENFASNRGNMAAEVLGQREESLQELLESVNDPDLSTAAISLPPANHSVIQSVPGLFEASVSLPPTDCGSLPEVTFSSETDNPAPTASKATIFFAYLKRKRPFRAPELEANWKHLMSMSVSRQSFKITKKQEEFAKEVAFHIVSIAVLEKLYDPNNVYLIISDRSLKRALNEVSAFHRDQAPGIVANVLFKNHPKSFANFYIAQQEREFELAERALQASSCPISYFNNSKLDYRGTEDRYVLKPALGYLLSLSPQMAGKSCKSVFSLAEVKECINSYLDSRPSLRDSESKVIMCDGDVLGIVLGMKAFAATQLNEVLVPLMQRIDC